MSPDCTTTGPGQGFGEQATPEMKYAGEMHDVEPVKVHDVAEQHAPWQGLGEQERPKE